MQYPANLRRTPSPTITGVANTSVTAIGAAAPGGTLRYRLWGWAAAVSSIGAAIITAGIQDTANFENMYVITSFSTANLNVHTLIPGGIRLAVNQAITFRVFTPAGGAVSLRALAYYTIEETT